MNGRCVSLSIAIVVLLAVISLPGSIFVYDDVLGDEPKAKARTQNIGDSHWPCFHNNVKHTGISYYNTSMVCGTIKWYYATGNEVISSPAISSNGTIYVGSTDNKLYALNPNGSLQWSYSMSGAVASSPAIGANGTIYVGSNDGKLYALNPNGTLRWSYSTGGKVHSSPAICANGTIYVGSEDGKLYALNPNGTLKWSYLTGWYVQSSPAIGINGTIFVGSMDWNFSAFNPNGTLQWSYRTEGSVYSSPAIGVNGTVYFGSNDCKLYALNPNGSLKWSYMTGGSVKSSPAIGVDGTIYVGSTDHKLYALNSNGSFKWSYTTDGPAPSHWVTSSPAIGNDGTIFVGSWDHYVYALNPNGTLKWSCATGDAVRSSPAIGADGRIYVGSSDFKLYAIGGKLTCRITSPTTSPTMSTGWYMIYLRGSAWSESDYVKVTSVLWTNSLGGSGVAYITPQLGGINVTWQSRGNIILYDGVNIITVTTYDEKGRNATDTLTVTYNTPPVVTITYPTSNPTMTTGWHMINLIGVASDDFKVTLVTWSNSLGGSGVAYMLPQWGGNNVTWQSRGNIMLYHGDNLITVTVYDNTGKTATDVLTVTYTGY